MNVKGRKILPFFISNDLYIRDSFTPNFRRTPAGIHSE